MSGPAQPNLSGPVRPRQLAHAAFSFWRSQASKPNYLGFVGVGCGRKRERKNSSTGPPFFLLVSGRVRRFLRRCSVGVGLGVGVVTVGTVGVAVRSGVAVGGIAVSAGVAVGNSMGVGDRRSSLLCSLL
jgi:hypothetical protein